MRRRRKSGCAGARKIRIDLGLVSELPPVRSGTVELVLAELDGSNATVEADLRWIGTRLMRLADEDGIGPGNPTDERRRRDVYAAGRLLGRRLFTQAEVAEAANAVVETSQSRVARYSRELYDVYVERYGSADPSAMLGQDPTGIRAD